MIKYSLLVLTILAYKSIILVECDTPLMCYVAAYAVYRPSQAKFTPDSIDPYLCTHLIYAHLGVDPDTASVVFTDPYTDLSDRGGYGLIEKVAAFKTRNPRLKVLFSIGGWNHGSLKFSQVAETRQKRREFAKNVVKTIRSYNFDGIDMNWMYPNHRGGKNEDVQNYVLLLKEIKKEMKKYNFLLVALMSGNEYIFRKAYDVRGMAEQLDYILLLSYDYHGFWDGKTGVFAPLRYTDSLSVSSSVEEYLRTGIRSDKLLLGFSTSGRTFKADEDFKGNNFFEVPAKESFSTAWTKEKGFIGFNEICQEFKINNLWSTYWDTYSSTPFAVSGRRMISFEDRESYLTKINYLKEKRLGGAMVWSLDTDDFSGQCYGKKYFLTSIIKNELQNYNVTTTVHESSDITELILEASESQVYSKTMDLEDESIEFPRGLSITSSVVLNIVHN